MWRQPRSATPLTRARHRSPLSARSSIAIATQPEHRPAAGVEGPGQHCQVELSLALAGDEVGHLLHDLEGRGRMPPLVGDGRDAHPGPGGVLHDLEPALDMDRPGRVLDGECHDSSWGIAIQSGSNTRRPPGSPVMAMRIT